MGTENMSNYWEEFLSEDTKKQVADAIVGHVVKRNDKLERYDRWKIASAIGRAIQATTGENDLELVEHLTAQVENKIKQFMEGRHPNSAPAIEEIQDIVETVLIEQKKVSIAKAYIIYRARHEAIRDTQKLLLDINTTMD